MGCKPSVLLCAQLHPLPTYQRMREDFLFKSLWWELFRLVPVRRKDYTDSKFPQSFSWPKSTFLHRLTIFLKKAEPPLTLKHLLSLSQCQWGTIWVIFWLNSIFFFSVMTSGQRWSFWVQMLTLPSTNQSKKGTRGPSTLLWPCPVSAVNPKAKWTIWSRF